MSKVVTAIDKNESAVVRGDEPADDKKATPRYFSKNMTTPKAKLILAGPTNGYCKYCSEGMQSGVLIERCGGDGFSDDVVCFACLERFVRQMKFVHAPDYLYP